MADDKFYHYSGSRVNTSLDEPLYLTKFKANIVLPAVLAKKYGSSNLLLEQMLKIDGLDVDKLPGMQEQKYRFTSRQFMGTIVDTKVAITMDFEVNVNPETLVPYPYDLLRDWGKIAYDPNTGNQSLKKDYAGSAQIIVQDKIGQTIRAYDIKTMWMITQLPAWSLNYTTEAIYRMNGIKFQCEGVTDALAGE